MTELQLKKLRNKLVDQLMDVMGSAVTDKIDKFSGSQCTDTMLNALLSFSVEIIARVIFITDSLESKEEIVELYNERLRVACISSIDNYLRNHSEELH